MRGMTQYSEPIHRWCSFSDSWPPAAVREIVSLLNVQSDDWIWDPFGGSGTTAVVAKSEGICSITSDIDPLSVLFAHIKTHPPGERVLEQSIWPEDLSLAQLFDYSAKHSAQSRSVAIRTTRFLIAASLLRSGWHLGEAFDDQRIRAEFSRLRNEMLSDRFRTSNARAFVYHSDFLARVSVVRRLTNRRAVMVTSPPFPGSDQNPNLVKLMRAIGLPDKTRKLETPIGFERYRLMLDSIADAAAQVDCRALAIELTARCSFGDDRVKSSHKLLVEALKSAGYEASIASFNTGTDDPSVLCVGVRL